MHDVTRGKRMHANTDIDANKTWFFSASLKNCNEHPEYLAGERTACACFRPQLRSNTGAVFCRHD